MYNIYEKRKYKKEKIKKVKLKKDTGDYHLSYYTSVPFAQQSKLQSLLSPNCTSTFFGIKDKTSQTPPPHHI